MKKKRFNTFGELEAKIMEIVWGLENASVRDVLNRIKVKAQKKPAYTTIMTVMARLCEKEILGRKFNGDTYIYAPVQNKEQFLSSASKKILNNLINDFGEDVAVAGFIDALESNNIKKSEKLRNKLKKIIK
ncbi:MAG: BlaI/MecI/CopY family transcriptional regulator [bacterium]